MKNKKPVFFIVFFLIIAFAASTVFGVKNQYGDLTTTYINGVKDIRLGIDIQGGVDVTFAPADDSIDADQHQLESVQEVMKTRLINLGINDYESYIDESNDKVIVRFPWQSGEENFDPEAAVAELGETAKLQFRKGYDYDEEVADDGTVTIIPKGDVILEGTDVKDAYAYYTFDNNGQINTNEYCVNLVLKDDGDNSGKDRFFEATTAACGQDSAYLDTKGSGSRYVISIWMDNNCISYPQVNDAIDDGSAQITGSFDYDGAKALADKINGGALPFNLKTETFKTISPSMGTGALQIMVTAGIISLILIMIYMIVLYRLPGFVASIALIGQVAGTLAVISGWFGFYNSNTLTIPGIAGIILAIGMGVDCNIITGERIKEELNTGKSLEAALKSAYHRSFTSILDGNMTIIIVAIILMGAFGVSSSFFSKILHWLFFMFGVSTEGTIYSFGFTLLTGVIFNFIMGVLASRLMLTSLSKFKCFQNRKLYGGAEK